MNTPNLIAPIRPGIALRRGPTTSYDAPGARQTLRRARKTLRRHVPFPGLTKTLSILLRPATNHTFRLPGCYGLNSGRLDAGPLPSTRNSVMSLLRAFSGVAVFLLVLPLTTAHEQYSTLGDLLHWYAHSAQTHPSLVRYARENRCLADLERRPQPRCFQPACDSYTELKEPGYEHTILPLATFTNYAAGEGEPSGSATFANKPARGL
jgi:hypothetical protein